MANTLNPKDYDQSTWACYHLPNNSYYYGEIAYLDESSIVHPKQNPQAASNPKNKLVKHGHGVYLYNIHPEIQIPQIKYFGQWDKDQKFGKGQLIFADGTIYQGNFHQGHYHGNGKIAWPSGDSYQGTWKRSKMDGSGVFKQSSSNQTLKGQFKNNYFIDDNILRNPFLQQKQFIAYKKQRKQVMRQKQKQQKVKYGFVKKITSQDELKECIDKSTQNNRVTLVLATKNVSYSLADVQTDLHAVYGQQSINVMDLRNLYSLQGQQKEQYRNQVHQLYRQSLINGQIFIVSLDESEVEFTQMFYPDLKDFYDPNGFNNLAWSRLELQKKEVRNKIIEGKELHKNFKLILWTKLKLSPALNEQTIYDQIALRFQKLLPLIKIDLVVKTPNPN